MWIIKLDSAGLFVLVCFCVSLTPQVYYSQSSLVLLFTGLWWQKAQLSQPSWIGRLPFDDSRRSLHHEVENANRYATERHLRRIGAEVLTSACIVSSITHQAQQMQVSYLAICHPLRARPRQSSWVGALAASETKAPVTGTNGNLQVCLPKVLGYPWGTLDGSGAKSCFEEE